LQGTFAGTAWDIYTAARNIHIAVRKGFIVAKDVCTTARKAHSVARI